jgi:hypothetical protein
MDWEIPDTCHFGIQFGGHLRHYVHVGGLVVDIVEFTRVLFEVKEFPRNYNRTVTEMALLYRQFF